MAESYIPVPCGFYDQLEAFSVLGTPCTIVYRQTENRITLNGRITDLYTREKVEYLRLDTGPEIRLDSIIDVNGVKPAYMC